MDGKHSSAVLPLSGDNSCSTFDLDSVDKWKAFVEMLAASKISIGCLNNFQRVFTSSIKPLSREIVEGEIQDLYEEKLAGVKQELATVIGRISSRIGIWANIWDMNSNRKFIGVTSRWIDDDWAVQERILVFRAFLHPYYPEDIDQWLSNWKIDRKLLGMCFDDESYQIPGFVDAFRSCINDESQAASFLNIQCFGDMLNSIVQSSLNRIEPIVDKIRGGISYILGQRHQMEEFYELAQRSYWVDVSNKKLICDFQGRWDSTYMMLDRALVYKKALLDWGRKDEMFKEFSLEDDEWENVDALRKFLRVFYEMIGAFSRTKYLTSNMFLRSIYDTYSIILRSGGNEGSHHHDFMGGLNKDAGEKLRKYFLDNSLVLSCAVILDPHCKEDFAENCYILLGKFDESMAMEYVNRDRAALYRLFDEYKEKFSSLSSHGNEEESELDRYLEEEISNIDQESFGVEFDILEYWKKSARYPVLAMLARDILAIPVSSVLLGSEAFYMGKNVLMGEPTSRENLQVRTCLADWFRVHTHDQGTSQEDGHEEDVSSDTFLSPAMK